MKRVLLFTLLINIFFVKEILADDDTYKMASDTVVCGGKYFGLSIFPELKCSSLKGLFSIGAGIEAEIVTGHQSLGLFINYLNSLPRDVVCVIGCGDDISLIYYGIDLGYVPYRRDKIHVKFNLLLSNGNIKYKHVTDTIFYKGVSKNVFVIEPEINLEISLSKNFDFGIGLGYRFVSDLNLQYISKNELNFISGNLYLKYNLKL